VKRGSEGDSKVQRSRIEKKEEKRRRKKRKRS